MDAGTNLTPSNTMDNSIGQVVPFNDPYQEPTDLITAQAGGGQEGQKTPDDVFSAEHGKCDNEDCEECGGGAIRCKSCGNYDWELAEQGYKLYDTKYGPYCRECAEDEAIHHDSSACVCDDCFPTTPEKYGAESFNAETVSVSSFCNHTNTELTSVEGNEEGCTLEFTCIACGEEARSECPPVKWKGAESFGAESYRCRKNGKQYSRTKYVKFTGYEGRRNPTTGGFSDYVSAQCYGCGGDCNAFGAETFEAQYIEMDCDPHHKWKLIDTPYIDYGDGSSGYVELSVKCKNCGEERWGSYSIDGKEPCALDLQEKGVKPRYYRWGAESFSEAGLELRTAGRCGCEQDDLWEVVNVESPVFLCSTCGYAGNKKEDGHFMHMKNIWNAESKFIRPYDGRHGFNPKRDNKGRYRRKLVVPLAKGAESFSADGITMDDEGMRHSPHKECPDCGAKPTSSWIDPGKCECGRVMNPSQYTNISFSAEEGDLCPECERAELVQYIAGGNLSCPQCGRDYDIRNAESFATETRFIPVQVMEVTEWFKDRFGHYPDFSRQEGSKFHSGYVVVVRGQMVDKYDTKEEADQAADAIRIAISFLGGMTADDGTHPRSQREMMAEKIYDAETFESDENYYEKQARYLRRLVEDAMRNGCWTKQESMEIMDEASDLGMSFRQAETFESESLVEEPDWIPAGDGRALGQQNLDINLSPLHAEGNLKDYNPITMLVLGVIGGIGVALGAQSLVK